MDSFWQILGNFGFQHLVMLALNQYVYKLDATQIKMNVSYLIYEPLRQAALDAAAWGI